MGNCCFDIGPEAQTLSGTAPPAVEHDGKADHECEKADLVDAVHHAKIDARILVFFEQVERVQVMQKLLKEHGYKGVQPRFAIIEISTLAPLGRA